MRYRLLNLNVFISYINNYLKPLKSNNFISQYLLQNPFNLIRLVNLQYYSYLIFLYFQLSTPYDWMNVVKVCILA